MEWEQGMGETVEVFFPTLKTSGMSQAYFEDLRSKNITRGNNKGQRKEIPSDLFVRPD